MDKKITLDPDQLHGIIQSALKQYSHDTPSSGTKDLIGELRNDLKGHIESESGTLNLVYNELFGNKATGEVGIIAKVNEMHTILTQIKGVTWTWKWLWGGLISVAGAWVLFKGLFHISLK